MTENILVIKLGALGDFFYALGAMKAIRAHHKDATITLLTQKPYVDLARQSGYFDDIFLDPRPKYNPLDWFAFRRQLNGKNFTRVYDLQNNDRTELYFKLFSPRPEWVGIAEGASHRNTDPARRAFHAFTGLQKNLALAGIEYVALDPLNWLQSDLSRLELPSPYALLVPGSSDKHPAKRWPTQNYRMLAQSLLLMGLYPVVIASEAESGLAEAISRDLPVTNLAGKTGLGDLASLGRGAEIAIGNDTGPSHLISMTGCPVIMFFRSDESTVLKHGPQAKNAVTFEADDLEKISVEDVVKAAAEARQK